MKKMITLFLLMQILATAESNACTRVVYQGPGGLIITARSMDWASEIPANLWVFPRGMQREGRVGPNSVNWISRYGSIVASSFDMSTADGMNEKGLVANLLWLAEAGYPPYDGSQKGLTVAAWAQYVLDNFATVAEAVEALSKEEFVVVSGPMPGLGREATVHMSLSDAEGNNAILEYIHGKLVVHHDRTYLVMTNSPVYEQQLAINKYWQGIGGSVMLPGTSRAADRFVRASYYIQALPQIEDPVEATAAVLSVIRNCSVPYGIPTKGQPNISTTRWRSVADQKHLIYYFETLLSPNTIRADLNLFDLSEGAPVRKLDLAEGQVYNGETSSCFLNAVPFVFQGL
ncbi:MAG: linear amide C-N hydrolase [Bacteroidales bacterium]|jgi:choloylglycine hydrolase|nr:linear amide C-N hydrolase [Bacteroidales bacterium]MDY0359070.1 linear amide C-N hydrolase [Bacteroidales bacterium]NLN36744.1 linear amide C-N hydrolase [Bacteroidales bacterium]